MNGDSGGDYEYGDDGADVMWGGRGNPALTTPDQPGRNAPGADGQWIDVLFGGRGLNATEAGADILDYQPRPSTDPAAWFTLIAGIRRLRTGELRSRRHASTTTAPTGSTAAGTATCSRATWRRTARTTATSCSTGAARTTSTRTATPPTAAGTMSASPTRTTSLGLEKLAYVTGARTDFDGAPTLADVQALERVGLPRSGDRLHEGRQGQHRQGLLGHSGPLRELHLHERLTTERMPRAGHSRGIRCSIPALGAGSGVSPSPRTPRCARRGESRSGSRRRGVARPRLPHPAPPARSRPRRSRAYAR